MKEHHHRRRSIPRVRENKLLIWDAIEIGTGGNVHDRNQLIAAYQNAIEAATDRRCKDKAQAVANFKAAEAALYQFVYPAAKAAGF